MAAAGAVGPSPCFPEKNLSFVIHIMYRYQTIFTKHFLLSTARMPIVFTGVLASLVGILLCIRYSAEVQNSFKNSRAF